MKKIYEKVKSDLFYYDCLHALGYSQKEIQELVTSLTTKEAKEIINDYSKKELQDILVSVVEDNDILYEKNNAKKIGLLLAALLSLGISVTTIGCTSPFLLNIQGYEVLNESLDFAWTHVSEYPYKMRTDRFPSPHDFESYPGGTCGGFAGTMVYYLGKDASLAVVDAELLFPNRPEAKGVRHAIVYYKGKFLEPQTYGKYYNITPADCDEIWSYDKTMLICTAGGLKNIDDSGVSQEAQQLKQKAESIKLTNVPVSVLLGE